MKRKSRSPSTDTNPSPRAAHRSPSSRAQSSPSARTACTRDLVPAVARALSPIVAQGLGFDLDAAIRTRRVRLLALHTTDGRPLPRDWAIPLRRNEVVVACAPLERPFSGVAALIAQPAELPAPRVDTEAREQIADALARALLFELCDTVGNATKPVVEPDSPVFVARTRLKS